MYTVTRCSVPHANVKSVLFCVRSSEWRGRERRRAALWTCGLPCKHEWLSTFIFYFVKNTWRCIISNKFLERLEKHLILSLCSLSIYCINTDWMLWCGKTVGKGTTSCSMVILTNWPVLSAEMKPIVLQSNYYFSCKTSAWSLRF